MSTSGDAAIVDSPRRSLQERLSAGREPDHQPPLQTGAAQAPADAGVGTAPTSSRRTNPWTPAAASASQVQQVINPTIGAAKHADTALPSLARSPATGETVQQDIASTPAGRPVATTNQTPTSSALVSSRRGFSAESSRTPTESPSERIATALPARDRLASAVASDSDLLFKRQAPLISVETAGPRTIRIGREATYVVSVHNAGDVAAADLTVTIRVPEWADCMGAKASSGAAQVPQRPIPAADNGGGDGVKAIQWALPRLEAKSSERLSLQIVPRQSRPFDLAVQCTVTPLSSAAVVQVQEPKLAMSLTGPSEVLFGDTKVYTMTLSNPGTGDAENVVIHLSPVTGQGGAPTKHQIGTIKAAANKTIEIELTARQAGKIMIHAAATAEGGLEAEVSEEVIVRRAELEMKIVGGKVKYAGAVATYQIEVNNPGNAPAENVRVAAVLPAGAKFVAASAGGQPTADGAKVQWTISTIRPGGDARLDLKCQVNTPGANRLSVQSTAEGELATSAEEVSQVEALADLKLDVIEPKGPIAVGADVVYEIRVHNRGTKAARDVKVVGYFSGKIDPVAATGGEHRIVPGIVVFNPIVSLEAGGEMSFKVNARAKAPGNHMFKAEVLCETAGAKLGSEHTTLFYGDETISDPTADAKPHEDTPRPLVPKSAFETEQPSRADSAPALQAVPAPQPGSAYAPPKSTGPSTPALPVSPFGVRGNAKK
jgi:uncharacterized repeat protein (TIGR01451 family)